MSTNELNIFLQSFNKPANYDQTAWNHVIGQAKTVWENYLTGKTWEQALQIPCKEAYLMLVNEEGQLIVRNDSLLSYAKTSQNRQWLAQLESIAMRAVQEKRYAKAEKYFTKALKLDPQKHMNYYRRAVMQLKQQKPKAALEDLCAAIELCGTLDMYHIKRAEVYRLLDVDHKAMADLNKVIQQNPTSVEALRARGMFRVALGDVAGGRMDIAKANALIGKAAA